MSVPKQTLMLKVSPTLLHNVDPAHYSDTRSKACCLRFKDKIAIVNLPDMMAGDKESKIGEMGSATTNLLHPVLSSSLSVLSSARCPSQGLHI